MANSLAWITGGAFDPSQVSGLVLRLESSSLTGIANGNPVHTWPDLGPNAWDFSDLGEANPPTITTNVFGTLPGVTFDNVTNTDNLSPTAVGALGMAQNVPGFTIFTVAKWNGAASAAFQFVFMATTNGTKDTVRASVGENANNWISRSRRLDADAGAQSVTAATANVGVCVVGQTDYVGGTTTVWLQGVAGTPQALASSGGNSQNTTSGEVQAGADGTNSVPPNAQGFCGNIGAILCYSRSLTSTEIGNVTTWLRNKYSV